MLVPLFLAACDGGSKNQMTPDAVDHDAPPEPDAAPPPNLVSVDSFGETAVFIRYRNGDGPWLTPTTTSNGYEFRVDTSYELVAVCGDATNGFDVAFEAATWEEVGGETFLPCFATAFDETTHPLTGTMVQAGSVSVGTSFADSPTGNWSFSLDAVEGANDLLAVGGGRMLMRRNISVTATTTTPPIDLVQDGVATTTLPLTLNGLETDDVARTRTYLLTQRAFFILADEAGAMGRIAPASQLAANDAQFISIQASGGIYRRTAFKRHTTISPASTFTLMPRLEGVQLGNATATWTSIPAGNTSISAFSGISSFRRTVSEGWLAGRTSLAIDTEVPGFLPEWKLGTIDFLQFEVSTLQGSISYRSGVVAAPPSLRTLARVERVRMESLRRTYR